MSFMVVLGYLNAFKLEFKQNLSEAIIISLKNLVMKELYLERILTIKMKSRQW